MKYYRNATTKVLFEVCCLVLFSSYSKGSLQSQYIGCYHDIPSQSNWTNGNMDSNDLSVELCLKTCSQRRRPTTYAILQNGKHCLCGDVLNASSPNYACDTRCSGNKRQVCGGPNGSESPYVVYTVCPIGFYGADCDKECHCKQRIPCDRLSGICPNGCENSWTLANCSKETCESVSKRSIGCYADAKNRTFEFEHEYYFISTSTVELCSYTCAARNYTYAGIEVGAQCFCGESYSKYGRLNDSSCVFGCDGDRSQSCGGHWALSVYFACPIGYFGRSCLSRCNCKTEQRCTCANCTCSSGCKPGWMGNRCEFRICSENNGDCSENEACVTVDQKYSSIARCHCKHGYKRNRLWDTCSDIDECHLGTHNCDNMTATCINTLGSYICECRTGHYRVNPTLCLFYSAVVIAVAIGSAVGSALIFAFVLSIVIVCRRRQKKGVQHKDVHRIQRREETGVKLEYDMLNRSSRLDDQTYTELDHFGDQY